jgi:hypothetical protein
MTIRPQDFGKQSNVLKQNFVIRPNPNLHPGMTGTIEGLRPFKEPLRGKRGLIIGPSGVFAGDSVTSKPFDVGLLRAQVLLWDHIAYADNRGYSTGISKVPDVAFLENIDVFSKPLHLGPGGTVHANVRDAIRQTFAELEATNPGRWAVAAPQGLEVFGPSELLTGRGLLFRLTDALPVPSREVPLDAVLDFKQRRHSELLSLHLYLQELYDAIGKSGDKPLAELAAFERLDRSVADYIKAQLETNHPLSWSKIGAKFDGNAVLAAFGAAALAQQANLPMSQIALSGVAGFGARVLGSLGVTATLRNRDKTSPFEYILSIERELR